MSKESTLQDYYLSQINNDVFQWQQISTYEYRCDNPLILCNRFPAEFSVFFDNDKIDIGNHDLISAAIRAYSRQQENHKQQKIAKLFDEAGLKEVPEVIEPTQPSRLFKMLFYITLLLLLASWFPIIAAVVTMCILGLSCGHACEKTEKFLNDILPFGVFGYKE